ncbi:MAG: AAA family ATPase, partial [Actinomycetota bacterium]|nr:AAA family ATPase [Actinomycetota bacterium]
MATVEIDLLGRFAIRRDGREIGLGPFGGRLSRRVVRILAAERGQVLTREKLADALWGERLPADPDANLNALVNRARRVLGSGVIETVPGGYVMRGPDVALDLERFVEHVQRARSAIAGGDAGEALAAAAAARALWPGDPLPEDSDTEWACSVRQRLSSLYDEAVEVGAAAALTLGHPRQAVELAEEAVAREPLRESGHLLLMRALAGSGDRAAALAAYDRLRGTLADELGVDPSPAANEVHLRLLRGEPAELEAVTARPDAAPFVGRDDELALLAKLHGGRRVALVAGKAGSGKSRLLAEFGAGLRGPMLSARAVAPERETPWSLARTLLQAGLDRGADVHRLLAPRAVACLADLLPTLDAPSVHVEAQAWRALVLTGGVRLLGGPGVLVVDDLQWADSSSVELLAALARRDDGPAMVLAYRCEEIPGDSPVGRLLAELRATVEPVEVRLGRLTTDSINRIVASGEVAAALAEHTDGTPFAILETIRELHRAGVLDRGPSTVWRAVGDDVQGHARRAARHGRQRTIWARVQRQPTTEHELLGALALLDRPAPATLL